MRTDTIENSAASPEAGFTLFELLVTLALMALIASFIAGGLQLGRRTWETTRQIDRLSPSFAVRDVLRSSLAGAISVPTPGADLSIGTGFEGGPNALELVTAAPASGIADGLVKLRLRLDAHSGGPGLVLERAPFVQRATGGAVDGTGVRHILLDRIENLDFRYFGAAADGDAKSWHRSWTRTDRLPELVGIALTFAEGDLRSWPELIVDIRAGS